MGEARGQVKVRALCTASSLSCDSRSLALPSVGGKQVRTEVTSWFHLLSFMGVAMGSLAVGGREPGSESGSACYLS